MKIICSQRPAAMTGCPARGVVGGFPPPPAHLSFLSGPMTQPLPHLPAGPLARSPVREGAISSPPMGAYSHLDQDNQDDDDVRRRQEPRRTTDEDDDPSPRGRRRRRQTDKIFAGSPHDRRRLVDLFGSSSPYERRPTRRGLHVGDSSSPYSKATDDD